MQIGEFKLSSTFKGDKPAPWSKDHDNYNNHIITVSRNGKRIRFDFWGSIMNPEIRKEYELGNAFQCFVSDAISGNESFSDFCSEFGYDEDSRNAEKIWKACQKSGKKLSRIYDGDIYDLMTMLEKYN